MARTHFWRQFRVCEVVAMLPAGSLGIERVEIVEALRVGARSAEEIEGVAHIAERHAGAGWRTLTDYGDLAPEILV